MILNITYIYEGNQVTGPVEMIEKSGKKFPVVPVPDERGNDRLEELNEDRLVPPAMDELPWNYKGVLVQYSSFPDTKTP